MAWPAWDPFKKKFWFSTMPDSIILKYKLIGEWGGFSVVTNSERKFFFFFFLQDLRHDLPCGLLDCGGLHGLFLLRV